MPSNLSDAILNNLLDAVLVVDKRGVILYANKAADNLFSKWSNELTGHEFGYPVTPFDVQEIEILRNGKLLTIQMLASNITWNNESAVLLSLRDITPLRKIAKQLQVEKANLERLNQDLEQYASVVSHDLKEPLRKIIFFSDLLLSGKSLSNRADGPKDYLNKIHTSAYRMQSLLSGIAEYSTFATGDARFEPVDLNRILDEVLSDLELLIGEKKAKIGADKLPTVEAIAVQIHRLFLNIIGNAIQYAKKDVTPEIFLKCADFESFIEITISDNGIGFDDRYAEKAFLPFQRLHSREYGGSGIGLAICKKIVEGHGGTIKVKSIPGDGSQFIFTLEREHGDMLVYQ